MYNIMGYPEPNIEEYTLDQRANYLAAREKALAAVGRTSRRASPATMEFNGVTANIKELFDDDVNKLVTSFLNIQSIFSEEIEGVYFVPNKYIDKNSGFHERINLVVRIKGLHLLGYIKSSGEEKKSLLEFWNDKKSPKDRFWPVKTTKLVLTLNQIHSGSEILSIWVQGYSSMCSAEMFSNYNKKITMSPGEMFKLVR